MILITNNAISFTFLWEVSFLLLIVAITIPVVLLLLLLIKMPSIRPSLVCFLFHSSRKESFHHLFVSFVLFNCFFVSFFFIVFELLNKRFGGVVSIVLFMLWFIIETKLIVKNFCVFLSFSCCLSSE